LQGKVLFAEDTRFFAKQVTSVLTERGLTVVHAVDGQEAWEILNASPEGTFQLLLSDIEMPRMNGFELAQKVTDECRHRELPLVALTTRFKEADLRKGKEVGFVKYLEKLNRDQLFDALDEILGGES
jgi:two-component system, chemotaxis family, sensor kinase CheA